MGSDNTMLLRYSAGVVAVPATVATSAAPRPNPIRSRPSR